MPGYQSGASPSNYPASHRISLPPQHSLTNLHHVHAATVDRNPAARAHMTQSFEYPGHGEPPVRAVHTMERHHPLYSSSGSFIDSVYYGGPPANQQIAGSQYIYYPPRHYATNSSIYHQTSVPVQPVIYQQQPYPNAPANATALHHPDSNDSNQQMNSSSEHSQKPPLPPSEASSNGKQKPPIPRSNSKKTRSLKGSRAISVTDIFSFRRKKSSSINDDSKNGGPVKLIQKPRSTHEDLFFNVKSGFVLFLSLALLLCLK